MNKQMQYAPSIADQLRAIPDPQARAAEYLRIVAGSSASTATLRKWRRIVAKDAGVVVK